MQEAMMVKIFNIESIVIRTIPIKPLSEVEPTYYQDETWMEAH